VHGGGRLDIRGKVADGNGSKLKMVDTTREV